VIQCMGFGLNEEPSLKSWVAVVRKERREEELVGSTFEIEFEPMLLKVKVPG